MPDLSGAVQRSNEVKRVRTYILQRMHHETRAGARRIQPTVPIMQAASAEAGLHESTGHLQLVGVGLSQHLKCEHGKLACVKSVGERAGGASLCRCQPVGVDRTESSYGVDVYEFKGQGPGLVNVRLGPCHPSGRVHDPGDLRRLKGQGPGLSERSFGPK